MSRDSPCVTRGGTSLSWLQDKRVSPLLEDAEPRLGRGLQAPAGSQARFCSVFPKREFREDTPMGNLLLPLAARPRGGKLALRGAPQAAACQPGPPLLGRLPSAFRMPRLPRRVRAATQRSERAPSPKRTNLREGRSLPPGKPLCVKEGSPVSRGGGQWPPVVSAEPLSGIHRKAGLTHPVPSVGQGGRVVMVIIGGCGGRTPGEFGNRQLGCDPRHMHPHMEQPGSWPELQTLAPMVHAGLVIGMLDTWSLT